MKGIKKEKLKMKNAARATKAIFHFAFLPFN
jgi:hypothetical protein